MSEINLKNLDLNLLVVFEAIYAAGNISRAADQLAMSQPAVSNSLARLRELMDDALFVRDRRGVEPTLKAKQMIGPVREALRLIGRQLHSGNDLDLSVYRRQFKILMVDALEPIMMPPLLRVIGEQAPGVSVECVLARQNFVDDLVAGTLDLACFSYPINAPELVVVPICPVDVVVVARRDHPAIGKKLTRQTFESLGHIVLVPELRGLAHIEKDLVAHRALRRIVYAVNKIWSIAPIVERTDLIGMLPRWFAQEMSDNFDLAMHEVPVEISEQYAYMVWHAKNEHDRGHKWLRETMLSAMTNRSGKPENVTPLPRGRGGGRRDNSA